MENRQFGRRESTNGTAKAEGENGGEREEGEEEEEEGGEEKFMSDRRVVERDDDVAKVNYFIGNSKRNGKKSGPDPNLPSVAFKMPKFNLKKIAVYFVFADLR
jgi:hypothetical protein